MLKRVQYDRLSKEMQMNKVEARAAALRAQGLHQPHSFGPGKQGALNAVKHLGYIQLDTLSVVVRAHHHTLWTRADSYLEKHLDDLVKEKKIFEYWSHAAAYMPIEDFRFSLPRKELHRKGQSHWFKKSKKIMAYVLDRIKAEGPLQSRDFETGRARGSWFDWKPAKVALEQLFHEGTLMVSERKGFQKVYDLAENILPSNINTQIPTPQEYARYLIKSTLTAHGLASAREITHLRKGMGPIIQKTLNKMHEGGELSILAIEHIKEPYYSFSSTWNLEEPNNRTAILLSPFDNAVIMRNRLKNIFDFDYGIECYLPEHKRTYGYFCLPILFGDRLVGRLDPKTDRNTKIFEVKSLYIEQKDIALDELFPALADAIKQFAAFNGCTRITIGKVAPAKYKRQIQSLLK